MKRWGALVILLFLGLSFFLWRGLSLHPQELPSTQVGRTLPNFSIPVLGHPSESLNSSSLRGQFFLLNVWASWCSACLDEQVFLLQLARQGVVIVGLNYKDKPQNALAWLHQWGNPFQQVGTDLQGKVGIDLGVYGAPETFLVDPNGIILYRHVGIMDEETWKAEFLSRMHHDS